MTCKVDNKSCDPESLVCRFNPSETSPTYFDERGQELPMKNIKCSNFKKVPKK